MENNHKLWTYFFDLNYNSVVIDNVAMLQSIETLPGFEARAAFTVNSATVFREDVDIVQTIVDDTFSYVLWVGDNLWLIDRTGDKSKQSRKCGRIRISPKTPSLNSPEGY